MYKYIYTYISLDKALGTWTLGAGAVHSRQLIFYFGIDFDLLN